MIVIVRVLGLPLVAAALVTAVAATPPGPRRDTPDPVYFEDVVLPFLDANCATSGCHASPGSGRLFLERSDFAGNLSREQAERNLQTVLQFVEFGAPKQSRLVLKPLAKRDGGLPHSGSNYDFRETSEAYRLLADWIDGAELENVAPIADAGAESQAKCNQTIRLDGSKSRERRGRPLTYRWAVASRPEASTPILKESETAHPEFRADREGVYTLSLVVDNGDLESAPSTTTVEVDNLPFVLEPAEAFARATGFYVADDEAASGGRALRVGQEGANGSAEAEFDLMIPESGPYTIFARVLVEPEADGLTFRFDDGPEVALQCEPTGGYRYVAVAGSSGSSRLDEAGGDVVTGGAEVKGGRLHLFGSGARPARFDFGRAFASGALNATVRFAEPSRDELHQAALLAVFDVRDRHNFAFAGYELGRGRVVLGRSVDGRREVLASERVPCRPEVDLPLQVGIRDDRAYLFLDEGRFIEAKLGVPGGGGLGLFATTAASIDDLRVTSADVVVVENRFDDEGRPEGHLSSGPHRLFVRADGERAPALDEILLTRDDFEGSIDEAARREIRALYIDCLGRTPTSIEMKMAAGLDRAALARRLIGSLEFYETVYENELYYFLLLDDFRPSTPEMNSIPARLANGQLTLRDAIQEIVISQYFNARNPGNDTFVSVVLEQLLGIVVQDDVKVLDAGKKMYDGYKVRVFGTEGKSQSDLVNIVMAEPRFAPTLLARHFERLFHAPPPKGDLARWAERFADDPRAYETIVAEWLLSDAYDQVLARFRPKSDMTWIRSLYIDALERKPTFEEYRNFRNALQALSDSAALRSVLAKVILDSGRVALPAKEAMEPRAFVEEQFSRYLARTPTAEESAAFIDALNDPGCEPRTIVHAIVSSTEYQNY